jgi:fatty-acyl-CoA synthase
LLDRLIGAELPEFRTDEELRAFEAIPYAERIAAQNTYDALRAGAAHDPAAPAIHFLQRCEPDETPLTLSHAQFIAGVTQTANLLADLGVGPRDVVSFMLPLLPQSFFTLYGAEAAGSREPGELAARAKPDRGDPARGGNEGARRARSDAGLGYLGERSSACAASCPA